MARTQVSIEDLAVAIGEENAVKLARLYGGLRIPRAEAYLRQKRDKVITKLWVAGYEPGLLAARFRLTRQQIWNIVSRRLGKQKDESL